MGRPLRNEFLNKITAHYVKDGAVTTGKIVKQVGFNKFKAADGTIFRLCKKDDVQENLEAGTGYIGVKVDGESGYPHNLFKLTTRQIHCFGLGTADPVVYPFVYTFDVDTTTGRRTGITQTGTVKIQTVNGYYV